MNSLYGKFGQKPEDDVSHMITPHDSVIMNLLRDGRIHDVERLNEKYLIYSATVAKRSTRTNFMIASYITARARIQLI